MTPKLEHLSNKRLFAEWLGFPIEELEDIINCPEKYYRKSIVGKKKPREAEVPIKKLKVIQKKIKILLDELPSPTYRHCGLKGKSYKTNAQAHNGAIHYGSMDIKGYYKNSKRENVFRFLYYKLNIAADVAWFITDLVTYKGFIPTGSPSSQAVAFWSHIDTFDAINEFAGKNQNEFSLYVDDMGFSSTDKKLDRKMHLPVNKFLNKSGLKIKRSKVKYSRSANSPFEITGAISTPDGQIKSPNRLKQQLFVELDKVNRNVLRLEEKPFRSLVGVLRSIRNLEPNAFPSLYGIFLKQEKEFNRRAKQRKLQLKSQSFNQR